LEKFQKLLEQIYIRKYTLLYYISYIAVFNNASADCTEYCQIAPIWREDKIFY